MFQFRSSDLHNRIVRVVLAASLVLPVMGFATMPSANLSDINFPDQSVEAQSTTEVLDQAALVAADQPIEQAPEMAFRLVVHEASMLDSINSRRVALGLNQIAIDPLLTEVARERSHDMVNRAYFSHTTPDGTTFIDSLVGHGVTGVVGEILGRTNEANESAVESVVVAFTLSPGHYQHLAYSEYDLAGVGFAVSPDGMKYYTVLFQGDI